MSKADKILKILNSTHKTVEENDKNVINTEENSDQEHKSEPVKEDEIRTTTDRFSTYTRASPMKPREFNIVKEIEQPKNEIDNKNYEIEKTNELENVEDIKESIVHLSTNTTTPSIKSKDLNEIDETKHSEKEEPIPDIQKEDNTNTEDVNFQTSSDISPEENNSQNDELKMSSVDDKTNEEYLESIGDDREDKTMDHHSYLHTDSESEIFRRKISTEKEVHIDLNVNIHNDKTEYKKNGSSRFGGDGDAELGRPSVASQTVDGNVIAAGMQLIKTLDANRYATKKTIAQGMLDIALLTANASQLKYILQVGHKHEFYTLMLSLIIVSIILQAVQGILCVFLGSGVNINKERQQDKANNINNVCLAINVVTVIVNVLISAFDMRDPSEIHDLDKTTESAVTKLMNQ